MPWISLISWLWWRSSHPTILGLGIGLGLGGLSGELRVRVQLRVRVRVSIRVRIGVRKLGVELLHQRQLLLAIEAHRRPVFVDCHSRRHHAFPGYELTVNVLILGTEMIWPIVILSSVVTAG